MEMTHPTPEQLRDRIEYNPLTGKLTWKPIPHPTEWQISWNHRCAGKPAFNHLSKRGYLNGSWKPYTLTAHRVAWAMHYGEWPTKAVDHINGDRTDNRIENLREATFEENARNARVGTSNKSGVIGVHKHTTMRKWAAQIRANGKTVHLGVFDTIAEAAAARAEAEKLHGYHPNHGQ